PIPQLALIFLYRLNTKNLVALKQRDHEDEVAQPEHPTLPSPNNPPHHPSTTLLRVPNQQTPAFMSSCNTPDQGKVVVELPQAEKADVLPRLLNLLAIP